jgi:hypothetical protein
MNRDTQLQVWSKNYTDAQKWTLDAEGSLISKLTGYAVDSSTGDKYRVKTWDRNGSDAQVWILGYNSPSYFFLQNIQSGLVLGVQDSSAGEGTQVKMWTKNSTSSFPKEQVWKFTEEGHLQSALSPDLVLDINDFQLLDLYDQKQIERDVYGNVKLSNKNDTNVKWSFQSDIRGGILRSNLENTILDCLPFSQSGFTIKDPCMRKFDKFLTQKWAMVSLSHSKGALQLTDVTIPQGKLVLPYDSLSTFFICTIFISLQQVPIQEMSCSSL